ncbi:unnamed protein product [Phytophthora fragariaefolia]|uniref:Unnamed protein product n=1 Tax=Phytophthora fragariaefolia TaxID=1490495 RepID=A0A9W6U7R1_9STRA|nr:unnamed protein product [Phytophthora fragariaefolia]
MLVKQDPAPTTLEQAVDKATAIDDPIDNVARGMLNIGQAWATAPNAFTVPMSGTTGSVAIVPGVGIGAGSMSEALAAQMGVDNTELAFFTNPQGVYNKYTGTWDVPEGRFWDGRYWQPTKKHKPVKLPQGKRTSNKYGIGRGEKKAKVRVVQAEADDSDNSATDTVAHSPPAKKQKAMNARVRATWISQEETADGCEPMQAVHVANGTIERRMESLSGNSAASEEDMVATKIAVNIRLGEERNGRDERRAQCYVATVRPTMAALRYVWPPSVDEERGAGEGDDPATVEDERKAGEGDLSVSAQ